jgi:hypothetical protein
VGRRRPTIADVRRCFSLVLRFVLSRTFMASPVQASVGGYGACAPFPLHGAYTLLRSYSLPQHDRTKAKRHKSQKRRYFSPPNLRFSPRRSHGRQTWPSASLP